MWPAASSGRDLANYGPHASDDPGREPHTRARSGLTSPPSSIAHPVKAAWLTGICLCNCTAALIVIGANCVVVIAAVWRLMRSAIAHGLKLSDGEEELSVSLRLLVGLPLFGTMIWNTICDAESEIDVKLEWVIVNRCSVAPGHRFASRHQIRGFFLKLNCKNQNWTSMFSWCWFLVFLTANDCMLFLKKKRTSIQRSGNCRKQLSLASSCYPIAR